MEIRTQGNKKIVCNHIFLEKEIQVGSKWISSCENLVKIVKVENSQVFYTDHSGRTLSRESFGFQCRYCLIVE